MLGSEDAAEVERVLRRVNSSVAAAADCDLQMKAKNEDRATCYKCRNK